MLSIPGSQTSRSRAVSTGATSLIGMTPYNPCSSHVLMSYPRALSAQAESSTGLTYAQAGVSVDAGNALVEAIKPFVRATRRSGADAEIGGFGGVFDLKATGYKDPVLVSGTDGVGTKLRVAMDVGVHDYVGTDQHAIA